MPNRLLGTHINFWNIQKADYNQQKTSVRTFVHSSIQSILYLLTCTHRPNTIQVFRRPSIHPSIHPHSSSYIYIFFIIHSFIYILTRTVHLSNDDRSGAHIKEDDDERRQRRNNNNNNNSGSGTSTSTSSNTAPPPSPSSSSLTNSFHRNIHHLSILYLYNYLSTSHRPHPSVIFAIPLPSIHSSTLII